MEDRSFYVYAHYRLDTMEPFYIGKGKGNRKDEISRNPMHDNISKKHGHAVVILFDNLTEEESFYYEREVIEYLVFNEGYEIHCKNCGEFTGKFSYLTNFSFGGEGLAGYNCSEETKKKLSIASKKALKNPKTREKISKASKNYWENQEAREKQSISRRKHLEDPKERENISNAVKASWKNPERKEKQSIAIKKYYEKPESREKVSKSVKKRFEDPKEREKISEKLSGEKSYKAKSIYCKELNTIFSYIGLAEKYCKNVLNIKICSISGVCRGVRNFTGRLSDGTKLTWKYTEDVDQETLNNAEYIDSKKYEEIIQAKLNENK